MVRERKESTALPLVAAVVGVQLPRRHLCLSGGLAPGPPRAVAGARRVAGTRRRCVANIGTFGPLSGDGAREMLCGDRPAPGREGAGLGGGPVGRLPAFGLGAFLRGLPGRPRRRFYVVVRTTRKRASPDNIRSNPSIALDIGNVSISGRTPVSAANRNVSSESCEVPEGWPATDRL
jgi:hypothetical protein